MMIWTPANAAFRPDGTGGGGGNGDQFWESFSADTIRLIGTPWGKALFDSSTGRAILADNYFNPDQTSKMTMVAGGTNIKWTTIGLNFFELDDTLGASINKDLAFSTGTGPIVEDTVVPGDMYRIEVASGVVTATLVP